MKTKYMNILALALLGSVMGACSSDEPVLTHKDWSTTEYFNPTDESSPSTFYKPAVGYVADPMPFYDQKDGKFKILYLQEFRPNKAGTYHPFWCVETTDAASYVSLGELLPFGAISEQDAALGTGCVIYNDKDQTYYNFYTGHAYNAEYTGYLEQVMVATSKDFKNWTKDRSFLLNGGDEYNHNDFRDPHVFIGDDGKYHMVVSTLKDGKGVLAEYISTDLRSWSSNGVFMTMMWDRFYECPDIFKMGDWWYLVYSEKHDALRKVQYFKGKTLEDLKACTRNDAGLWPDGHEGFLDARGLYAGKTATDGQNRYIWGWCGTRTGNDNTLGYLDWAGNLVAHKVIQHADGTLTLGEVPAIEKKYTEPVAVKMVDKVGEVSESGSNFTLKGDAAVIFARLSKHNRITFTAKTSGNTDNFGVSFCRGGNSEVYYSLVVNAEGDANRKINFEQQGSLGRGFLGNNDGYIFSRPTDNTYNVTIVTDNSVCVVYINDQACYTNRIYGMSQNCWSINSYGGNVTIENLKITQY